MARTTTMQSVVIQATLETAPKVGHIWLDRDADGVIREFVVRRRRRTTERGFGCAVELFVERDLAREARLEQQRVQAIEDKAKYVLAVESLPEEQRARIYELRKKIKATGFGKAERRRRKRARYAICDILKAARVPGPYFD